MKKLQLLENTIINEGSEEKDNKVKAEIIKNFEEFEETFTKLLDVANKLSSSASEGKYGTTPDFYKKAAELNLLSKDSIIYYLGKIKNEDIKRIKGIIQNF